MKSPIFILNERIPGAGRTTRRVFVSAEDVAGRVAALGTVEREDRADGFPHPLEDGVMLIPASGLFVSIDADDYPLVRGYVWGINASGYAQAWVPDGDGRLMVSMHRLVMMVGPSLTVDHIDRDKRNNCKSNLRTCTRAENIWNTKLASHNTSGIKGVSRDKAGWRGMVAANSVTHTRKFATKEQAGEWVRAKRIELHGEFACHGGAV